jgi:hypothetical protein
LDACIAREIKRLRLRYPLSLDEFRGLYVSDEQADAVLAAGPGGSEENPRGVSPALSAPLAGERRWGHLAHEFALSTLEQDLILIALGPELDLRYETLYAYLNDDVTRRWPTASLAVRLLGRTVPSSAVVHALSPETALRHHRLVECIDPPTGRPSLLNAGFALTSIVSRFLQGLPLTPVAGHGVADNGSRAWSDVPFSSAQVDQLHRLASLYAGGARGRPAVVLVGPPGSGRMLAASAFARDLGLPLRTLDLRALRRAGSSISGAIADARLAVRLEPAVLCLCGLPALADVEGRVAPEMQSVLTELIDLPTPLLLLASPTAPWRDLLGAARALVLELGIPAYSEQLRLWAVALRRSGLALAEVDRRALADRFRFTPAQVRDAAATARDRLDLLGDGHAADLALVRDVARAQSRAGLGSLASLGHSPFGWDDLVLPPSTLTRLRELCAAIRLRHVVFGDWGFARRLTGGIGVKALFAGPSGTGKTMAAGVVAREVGLDLVKVDLSGLVSKYIGETEKNLDRVFAGARAGNALLFFDEADAVFGKRSEVKDAHDRYANVEVAYLLQRIEEHEGVVVLATNLRRNLDEAFSRRLHYVIEFPQPDAPLRDRLWRGMFPPGAPVDADVDFSFLSQHFELPGGDIRNVVLDAAFLAADQGVPIGMRHLVRGLARQMSKQGRAPSPSLFQRYHPLVLDPSVESSASTPTAVVPAGGPGA